MADNERIKWMLSISKALNELKHTPDFMRDGAEQATRAAATPNPSRRGRHLAGE